MRLASLRLFRPSTSERCLDSRESAFHLPSRRLHTWLVVGWTHGPRVFRRFRASSHRREILAGWLFVAPALVMYVVFVLQPLALTIQYSFLRWNGIGPATWVGLSNYQIILSDPDLRGTIFNALRLVLIFSFGSVGLGLLIASVLQRVSLGRFGSVTRTVLFLPQIIPLVASGIIWAWLLALRGLVNSVLRGVGMGGFTRAWLGDFDWALPAVGVIGVWVMLGFCTLLLQTGMSKIDRSLYEAARLDGAGWFAELRWIPFRVCGRRSGSVSPSRSSPRSPHSTSSSSPLAAGRVMQRRCRGYRSTFPRF